MSMVFSASAFLAMLQSSDLSLIATTQKVSCGGDHV